MGRVQPISWYVEDNHLEFHLLDVGEGLMTLIIFPDNKVMLFDCNVTDENKEEILTYLDKVLPEKYSAEKGEFEKPIDIFANSHRDEDHYRGLKKVNEKFPIKSIWDSGQSGATTISTSYQYYMRLRRKLKEKDPKNLFVPTPSNISMGSFGGVNIYCLAAEGDFIKGYINEGMYRAEVKIQHTNSMVLLLEYMGRKLLMTGDSDWKSWKEKIVPNFDHGDFLKSEILIASHHGSRSFFTDEENDEIDEEANPETTFIDSIKLISPSLTLISCGKYDTAHHPNKKALKLYKEHTSNEQVYTTNSKGHLTGFIDERGHYSVIPSRFMISTNTVNTIGFNIKCKLVRNGLESIVESGDTINTDCNLKFTIETYGGIIEPVNELSIYWEVSNGGKLDHHEHQEIYYKGKDESDGLFSFSRELVYKGTHLLRCRVFNKKKKYSVTKIFSIEAI